MRILHVDTATEWRGGQNQIVLTVEGQLARNHEVLILANARGQLAARSLKASLPVHEATVGRGDLSWSSLRAIKSVVGTFAPDVIHVHESHGILGSLLAARSVPARPRVMASRRVDFPLRFLSRRKYGQLDRVLAVSHAVRDVLLRHGLPPHRIALVHEGVKDRAPGRGAEETLLSLGVPAGAPIIGNVAQLVDHKDHATLIRAAALVLKAKPECRFLICGDGPTKGALLALSAELGIQKQIIFAGFRDDLDALIPMFDIFCLSSHLEGLGTSVLDAMCFARPVVATRAGGVPDAVVDGKTGRLVEPRDYGALANALTETLNSPATLKSYGAAGRERFCEKFTSNAMVDATLAAYA